MLSLDINRKFEEILLKNGIIQKTSFVGALEALQDLQDSRMPHNKVGLYGVGIEAEGLLHLISGHIRNFKIDVCFDKTIRSYKYKKIIQNTSVHPIEDIIDMDVDYMILGSYRNREIFLKNLNSLGYHGRVMDLYSYLEGYIHNHFTDYEMVYHTRKAYLETDEQDKASCLKGLIKEYLLLKDFKNSFRYMDEYKRNNYPDYCQYEKLKEELCLFLKEIKECIAARNKKDIIINWIDALSYYDVPQFPFLQKKSKEGVCFENAYTVTPWTTETTKTILFGEYPIEGRLFLRETFSINNTKLLKILDEKGYQFGYCGMAKIARIFDESVQAPIHCYESKFSGSMQKQWDALDILCQSEKPVCVLIHTLRETHEPFIGGESSTLIGFESSEHDWAQDICRQQAEEAGNYIDAQLAFYEEFYKKNAVMVYMSDHGRIGNNPMNEKKIHTVLIINGKNIAPSLVTNMFSLVKFPELIKNIIAGETDWDSLTDSYALIENLDAYSEIVVQRVLAGTIDRKEMYQCRGIVTLSDKYFLYAGGKEYYFINSEIEKNKIDKQDCQERIIKLKKLCGTEFIDISQYEKFRYSRLLYSDNQLLSGVSNKERKY